MKRMYWISEVTSFYVPYHIWLLTTSTPELCSKVLFPSGSYSCTVIRGGITTQSHAITLDILANQCSTILKDVLYNFFSNLRK